MLRDTLKTLLAAYGPTGSEHAVAEAVKTLLEGHVDSMRTDHMGNLIVEKFGSQEDGKRIMFSAHMDHIGLVVTNIEKEGFLRVSNVGGINPGLMRGRKVVFEDGTPGVCMIEPNTKGETKLPTMEQLFIDIGAENREEAEKLVQVGDMAVYAPDFIALGKHRVAAPAMDDRCACALLVEMLLYAEDQKNTIIGVFSTQEEVGLRGATVAAFNLEPDIGLALDVTGWGDTPEVKYPAVEAGRGPGGEDHGPLHDRQPQGAGRIVRGGGGRRRARAAGGAGLWRHRRRRHPAKPGRRAHRHPVHPLPLCALRR